jgi:hypothetical protein
LKENWVPLERDAHIPTVHEALNSVDAIRQQVGWTKSEENMKDKHLHSVLMLGFRKPRS